MRGSFLASELAPVAIIARRMTFEESCKLLVPHAFGDLELWVSAKSYTDIYYVLSKKTASEDIQKAFLRSLELFNVCSVDKAALARAASLSRPDFEDCLISVCAERIDADVIVTRDAKGFARSTVRAYSPGEMFQLLRERGLQYAIEEV